MNSMRQQSAKKWLSSAFDPANKGKLHRALGVPEGDKIPVAKLKSAASKGGKLGKRAQLALTARSFRH